MNNNYRPQWSTSICNLITLAVMTALCLTLLVSCGGRKEEAQPQSDPYADWQKYSYGHFVIYFSPLSRYIADKAGFARSYERFLTEISNLLEVPAPPAESRINLYVFSSLTDFKKITGRDSSYFDDSTIYWSGLRPYGYQLTKYLMAQAGIPEGNRHVLSEGLANLLDFSGVNYHDRTNRLINSGTFVGLNLLGDNAVFDTLPGNTQRSESASLVGFVMYNFGLNHVIMLNSSMEDWNASIEALFNMDTDKLEAEWRKFVLENSDDRTGTVENDTTQKVRIELDGQ